METGACPVQDFVYTESIENRAIKKLISLAVLALVAGAVKLDGIADGFRVPPPSVANTLAGRQEVRGVSVSNASLAEADIQCSIFNQTDADIFMQQDDGGEVLFSGCGGFF